MKFIRKLIPLLGILMGLWVIGSFGGVMLNLSNAEFWTTSLMWSLLASLLVMPALVMVYHASPRPEKRTSEPTQTVTSSAEEQDPFVQEDDQEGALWPEAEKDHASQK
jgi:hypothetical protein